MATDDVQVSEATQPKPDPAQEDAAGPDVEGKYSANHLAAKEILRMLEKEKENIVLTGDAETGKTWLAQEITKSAVSDKGAFYMSLWISLKQKRDDESLFQSIARQLCILTTADMWEDAENIDDGKEEEYVDGNLENLKKKVIAKLDEKKKEMDGKKIEEKHYFLLLVLDSEGVAEREVCEPITKFFSSESSDNVKNKLGDTSSHLKFLITTRKQEGSIIENSKEIEIQPFSGDEALAFLKKCVGNDVSNAPNYEAFCHAIKQRSKVLPPQIIMLAEALKHTAKDGPEAMERGFAAALDILHHADKDDPKPLLHFTYEKLPTNCMIDCFWHSCNFLGKHGGVHYNELITHWMLEGHLDLTFGLKKAYEKGYDVMMELITRGMLKIHGGNLITVERATLSLDDQRCRGLFDKSCLGLPGMLEGKNVFERMAPTDGMMKTVSVDKEGKSEASLLIDGSRLCREVPKKFFQAKQNLKVLAIFYPRLESLPETISKMLHVLVLRSCYLLNNVEYIKNLEDLVVLEVSGSPCLKEMSDAIFLKTSKLRSLNLSGLGIKSLPSTVSSLTELRRLVVKQCSSLEGLPKLAQLKQIEVIDLSGCSSLKKIQEKSFKSFEKLRVIDFSGTKIEKLPIVQTLKDLILLLVKGCDHLCGLRFMKHLPRLKVLDVSGATRIKEIVFDCFDDTDNLRILDLSETEIRYLPESLSKHLCDLKLQSCSKLEKIFKTDALKELKSLDLSNASSLENFPDEIFKNLKSLQSLNLSNSKAKSLPSLSDLGELRHLILKGCLFESLQGLEKLIKLVELDLSGCESLKSLPNLNRHECLEIINLSNCKALLTTDKFFEEMSWLQVLNLSETQIQHFPSLCKPTEPTKLRSLVLKNCANLEKSPDFNTLKQLEELDLRGTSSLQNVNVESLNQLSQVQTLRLSKKITYEVESKKSSLFTTLPKLVVLDFAGEAVESLPSLDNLNDLQQLLLKDCSSLTELPSLNSHLEVLDLSGTKVKNLGEKISGLNNLKRLHLPQKMVEEFKKENISFLPLEVNLDRCLISELPDIPKDDENGKTLFESLKENPNLWQIIRQSNSFVYSLKAQGKYDDSYGDSRKLIFSDIYFKLKNLPVYEKDGKFLEILEIQGFDHFPADVEALLEHTEYIALVENQLSGSLSSLKPGSLSKLKHLYVDCCPILETVFSSGQLPENLETLQIKFCNELKTLFGADGSANRGVETKYNSTGKEVQTTGPTKKEAQTTTSPDKKAQTSASTSSVEKQVHTVTSIDKGTQTTSSANEEMSKARRINLKLLNISHCPMLETVFSSSSQLPLNLRSVQIKFCDKLKSLFGQDLTDAEFQELQSVLLKCDMIEVPNHLKISPSRSFEEILKLRNASKE